jgi:D-sedoheptulose 7-phosphate isomerase
LDKNFYRQYLQELKALVDRLPLGEVERIAEIIFTAYQKGGTIFTFGNGGSAALASHMAADLGKATHIPGAAALGAVKRMKVLSVTDNTPMLTAWGNDTGYENIFASQMENFIQAGDIALGISGSGNSPNVLRALELARRTGATTVGLTGCGGGKMKALLDCAIIVPSNSVQQVEDAHLIISHLLLIDLRKRFAALACVSDQ